MSSARNKAVARHRERLRRNGLVRVEVVVPEPDAAMIREIATGLRDDPARRDEVRERLRAAIALEPEQSVVDLLAVDPDVDVDEYLVRIRGHGRDVEL
jgi:hypothetical protein